MELNKELDKILNDPLLDISDKEAELFDIPTDMKKAMEKRQSADYIAKHRLCEDFYKYRILFEQVHKDLRTGKRCLARLSKTENIEVGNFFIISGQMVLLESMDDAKWTENVRGRNARTRCIYENGTESDILLQTLRKSVMTDGYVVSATTEEIESGFFAKENINENDKVTGYVYVLSSLSDNEQIKSQKDLYKIGFSTNEVKQRIANAEHEPTYLMAPVKVVATYKVVNMNSQKLEDIIHQILKTVQFHVTVTDDNGRVHEPKEWFVVPLNILDVIIDKIVDGSIIDYTYNPEMQCLERIVVKNRSRLDTSGLRVLSLKTKKTTLNAIVDGEKKTVECEMKQSNIGRYTYLDEAEGKRYLRPYDVIQLYLHSKNDAPNALVQVKDITFNNDVVTYHLGAILEYIN